MNLSLKKAWCKKLFMELKTGNKNYIYNKRFLLILKCKSANLTIYRIAFYSNMAWLKWHIKIDLLAAYDLKSLLKESHRINSIKLIIGEEWIDSIHLTIQINFFFKRKISKLNKINNWVTTDNLETIVYILYIRIY